MEQIKVRAVITRTMKWSDTSKIVSLFCRDMGRIDVLAKGARSQRSNYRGVLESLNLVEAIVYHSPQRELQVLSKVSLEASFRKIREDLKKTGYALSIIELINIFILYDQKDAIFFDFLIFILWFLEEHKSEEIAFWYFILKLTSYLGFKPAFSACRQCGRDIKTEEVYFSYAVGSVICRKCLGGITDYFHISNDNVSFLAKLQNTHYRKIDQITPPDDGVKFMTHFLLDYLKYHTDQKFNLNSLAFIEEFKN